MSEAHFAFTVSGKPYLIALLKVREVARVAPITHVPGLPKYFRGVMNLRGRIVGVLDLRVWLSLPVRESSQGAVLILDAGIHGIGALVDSVDSVVTSESTVPKSATVLDIEQLLGGIGL